MKCLPSTFPPRSAGDIICYDWDAVQRGYDAFAIHIPDPGPEHTNGYRWGWMTAKRVYQGRDDGLDWMREEVQHRVFRPS